jgi:hypothetical protein
MLAQGETYQVGFELYRVSSTEFSDFVYGVFESGGNAGIDDSDLPKLLLGGGEKMSVYRGQKDYGIETRPLINCTDTLYLRLYNTPSTTTNFKLVVDLNSYPVTPGLTAVLKDKFLNTERQLKFGDTTNIIFTTTSNTNTTGLRFSVIFRREQVQTAPFTQLPPICRGETFSLPIISSNGVKGSWSPALNNTQTTIYTFNPSEGQCATTANMTVVVNQPITPLFNPYGPFNSGTNFSLPLTSNNGINGSWTPAVNNTQTTTYEFTPDAGQCASNAYLTVTINELPTAITDLNIENSYKIYPNPIDKGKGVIKLELNYNKPGSFLVSIYDFNGFCLKSINFQHGGGGAIYSIFMDQRWVSGTYLVRISNGNEIKNQKLIVVK